MAYESNSANDQFVRTLYRELRDPTNRSFRSRRNIGMIAKLKRAAGAPIEESMEAVSAVYYLMKVAIETMRARGKDIEFNEKYFPVYYFWQPILPSEGRYTWEFRFVNCPIAQAKVPGILLTRKFISY